MKNKDKNLAIFRFENISFIPDKLDFVEKKCNHCIKYTLENYSHLSSSWKDESEATPGSFSIGR